MKRFLLAAFVVVAAVAYLGGYVPEHRRRVLLENQVSVLTDQIAEAEARVRTARLLGDLLRVAEAAKDLNYGQAQTLSSSFFDDVRSEADKTPLAALHTALEAVLRLRDKVTSALARGDPAVVDTLYEAEVSLRHALGYPVPDRAETPPPAANPPTSSSG
jgi:hypothetical protein